MNVNEHKTVSKALKSLQLLVAAQDNLIGMPVSTHGKPRHLNAVQKVDALRGAHTVLIEPLNNLLAVKASKVDASTKQDEVPASTKSSLPKPEAEPTPAEVSRSGRGKAKVKAESAPKAEDLPKAAEPAATSPVKKRGAKAAEPAIETKPVVSAMKTPRSRTAKRAA